MSFFKFFEKSMRGIFLIFCMKLQQDKALKLIWMIFLGGKSCFEDFGLKGAKNEDFEVSRKTDAYHFSDFWTLTIFLILCIKLQ